MNETAILNNAKDNKLLSAINAVLGVIQESKAEKAVEALDVFPESVEKEFLVQLAYFTAKRVM